MSFIRFLNLSWVFMSSNEFLWVLWVGNTYNSKAVCQAEVELLSNVMNEFFNSRCHWDFFRQFASKRSNIVDPKRFAQKRKNHHYFHKRYSFFSIFSQINVICFLKHKIYWFLKKNNIIETPVCVKFQCINVASRLVNRFDRYWKEKEKMQM